MGATERHARSGMRLGVVLKRGLALLAVAALGLFVGPRLLAWLQYRELLQVGSQSGALTGTVYVASLLALLAGTLHLAVLLGALLLRGIRGAARLAAGPVQRAQCLVGGAIRAGARAAGRLGTRAGSLLSESPWLGLLLVPLVPIIAIILVSVYVSLALLYLVTGWSGATKLGGRASRLLKYSATAAILPLERAWTHVARAARRLWKAPAAAARLAWSRLFVPVLRGLASAWRGLASLLAGAGRAILHELLGLGTAAAVGLRRVGALLRLCARGCWRLAAPSARAVYAALGLVARAVVAVLKLVALAVVATIGFVARAVEALRRFAGEAGQAFAAALFAIWLAGRAGADIVFRALGWLGKRAWRGLAGLARSASRASSGAGFLLLGAVAAALSVARAILRAAAATLRPVFRSIAEVASVVGRGLRDAAQRVGAAGSLLVGAAAIAASRILWFIVGATANAWHAVAATMATARRLILRGLVPIASAATVVHSILAACSAAGWGVLVAAASLLGRSAKAIGVAAWRMAASGLGFGARTLWSGIRWLGRGVLVVAAALWRPCYAILKAAWRGTCVVAGWVGAGAVTLWLGLTWVVAGATHGCWLLARLASRGASLAVRWLLVTLTGAGLAVVGTARQVPRSAWALAGPAAREIAWNVADLATYAFHTLLAVVGSSILAGARGRVALVRLGRDGWRAAAYGFSAARRFAADHLAVARRAAFAGTLAVVLTVAGIAPTQRALGAVDCQDTRALLGLGAGLTSAPAAVLPQSLTGLPSEASWAIWQGVSGESRRGACVPPGALIVAYSPDKAELFERMVADYNAARPPDQPLVLAYALQPADMLESALDGKLDAISPDSGVWLTQLDGAWQRRDPGAPAIVGSTVSYVSSPLVIAMWESEALKLGASGATLGWASLARRATESPGFQWSHPAATTATGLLTAAAVYYAGAGKGGDLTLADLESPSVLGYVQRVEATVRSYGGESEDRVLAQLLNGPRRVDAFVAQEQLVVQFNLRSQRSKLVAIYPEEGTFVMSHPLTLLDAAWVTPDKRHAFEQFASFVMQPEQQRMALRLGYRPASADVPLDGSESPIGPEQLADPGQPRMLLATPLPEVLARIRGDWQSTKRPANIYLVVDVSGSMAGEKLAAAGSALESFLDQIENDREQVGLVAFSGDVRELQPLRPLSEGRDGLKASVAELRPGGDTALYDAVLFAVERLQERRDSDRINAVVVMTDGQDTSSRTQLEQLLKTVRAADPSVLIFAVAYGDDADPRVLSMIAEATDGQAFTSYPATVRRLYELVAQFF